MSDDYCRYCGACEWDGGACGNCGRSIIEVKKWVPCQHEQASDAPCPYCRIAELEAEVAELKDEKLAAVETAVYEERGKWLQELSALNHAHLAQYVLSKVCGSSHE